eukprot:CAMPEP_0115835836 /NCGR_PEP_ID=MMETSP0287-20121206/4398_1 /TAXON_ID=412157 /ORGANISM="Chrysochromulina rotalis, Strain UIO044" /LENGTH=188 /DNA_ID=CAMNT_0003289303 /DNA_START=70 /DNA_END=636 /DNA_ORIENTATION=+
MARAPHVHSSRTRTLPHLPRSYGDVERNDPPHACGVLACRTAARSALAQHGAASPPFETDGRATWSIAWLIAAGRPLGRARLGSTGGWGIDDGELVLESFTPPGPSQHRGYDVELEVRLGARARPAASPSARAELGRGLVLAGGPCRRGALCGGSRAARRALRPARGGAVKGTRPRRRCEGDPPEAAL